MATERRIVSYRGDVQGVGFRYTACRAASSYDVNGYVRNCPDGSVELVAEGDKGQIDAFLDDLQGRMGRHIRRRIESVAPYTGRFDRFGVRY